MDLEAKPTLSQAHPETMDFLSHAWCNFAVQAFQPEMRDLALTVHDSSIKKFSDDIKNKPSLQKMDKSMKMDDTDKSIPPWTSNDVKSWIWMQQAMHPELNYHSYLKKKWIPWKIAPLKNFSIKKWLKEMKQKRKEENRLQKAEVHAAISVAGVAAALAAIAAENSNRDDSKESAVASAAALVAAQCAKVAEAMGAKKEQLSSVIGSAMSGTSPSDIVTLTAAATTSLRGAATLKARRECKSILNGSTPVLPIEDGKDFELEYESCRSVLSKGAELNLETSDGRYMLRSVSIIFNPEAKVILRTRKLNILNAFTGHKESIILDLHAELYKDSEGEEMDTCYLIVLTTNKGIMKLDMMDDYQRYRMWSKTIKHMLTLSTSLTRYI
nr:VAN3-binding protein [Ipomoea batatas]